MFFLLLSSRSNWPRIVWSVVKLQHILSIGQEIGRVTLAKFKLGDLDGKRDPWDGLGQVRLQLSGVQLISIARDSQKQRRKSTANERE